MALVSSIAITSAAALIALFGILSGPSTLPVGSFYIASFISFTDIMWLILIRGGRDQLLVFYKSAQPVLGKNLSISIFFFLLLFIYWSCSVQWSTSRQGSPSVFLAAYLFYFNIRQSLLLYSLVVSEVIFSKKRRQLFLPFFCIVFLSLFLKAIQL